MMNCSDAVFEPEICKRLIAETPMSVMVTDSNLRIIQVNKSFVDTTGYSPAEAIGQTPRLLSSERHDMHFYEAMWHSILDTGQWQGEIWNRRKDGEVYPEWLNINVIRDDDGAVSHYAGVFSDISAYDNSRKRLHHMAHYDALTGLANRVLLYDRLGQAIEKARRDKAMLAVMFIDLDHFKRVNDSLGHRAGDRVLNAVAETLRQQVRQSDTVARISGDEFVVVFSDIQAVEHLARVAGKMVDALEQPFDITGEPAVHVSASIGVSVFPMDGENAESLLQHADIAMYKAKESGRNSFMFYTDQMGKVLQEHLLLERDLRKALDNRELTVVYQPQVCVQDHRITGFEVLLRWYHPLRGWISPAVFIPIAENAGLISVLTRWVFTTACMQLKDWHQRFDQNLKMAVNISGKQFKLGRLDEEILGIIQSTGVAADRIELELTETSLIDNVDKATEMLNSIREHGVCLAIDDFGTGYSSLNYLKMFDVDKLKIDRSFVQALFNGKSDSEIVTAIIGMANNLNIAVIAEGVETKEQLLFLQERGCDEIQGYYFSTPESPAVIAQLLEPPLQEQN
ncbi:putative bifunctional diguanylate cyclase/phosphodiesterase [Aliamphritea hakodatensis]|uniref:putative bifunctional diguanylate cyclase/phosphodiesterase n=1 Tax=Aliamphritea hakodatensis TaxID=2895352 RepID=UPI0022FD40BF|nr:GGDEF domain-containing phosphodiesterase [Aliamphritea hakodatensis]